MDGWIKISRNIVNWDLFKDGNVLKVWIYLLAHTNYEDSQMPDGRTIRTGQVVYSYRGIAKECGMSEREVRTVIKKLVATHSMTHEATHQYSIGTLENWDKYQSNGSKATHKATHEATPSNKYNKKPVDDGFNFGRGTNYHK